MGHCYVAGLPPLGSAGQKYHEFLAVGTIVDTVLRTEVDPKLGHALANPLVVAEVSKLNPVDPRLDARASLAALALQPLAKVVRAALCNVMDYFDQGFIVAYWLQGFVAIAKLQVAQTRLREFVVERPAKVMVVGHTRAMFERNLAGKIGDTQFNADMSALLRLGFEWRPSEAAQTVSERLIRLLPGEHWKGDSGAQV